MVFLQFSCLFCHGNKMTATASYIIYSQEYVTSRKEKTGWKRDLFRDAGEQSY